VELVHERESVEVVGLPTEKDPGAVGAVATDTDVVAVVVPFAFVAVIVYIVVEVGFTDVDPMRVLVLKPPGVIATDEAFVIFHESVDVPAEATSVGDAEKEEMEGIPFDCSLPNVSNVPGFASLLYSVAIQSEDRETFEMRTSSRVPFNPSILLARYPPTPSTPISTVSVASTWAPTPGVDVLLSTPSR
jgi:hypothetical protein